MRDYGSVSPRFWIGETGKSLRGDAPAQVLALYLMTCPHASMTGVFYCPVMYMAHETGLGIEGASKALARLIEEGFCEYEEASDTVFVVRMAAYQIGESLKPGDKRILGLCRELERMPESRMKARFIQVFGKAYRLVDTGSDDSPSEAPSKPHRSQEQEQEQEQDIAPSEAPPAKGKTSVSAKQMVESLPGLSEPVAADFIAHRKAKRAPLTASAWQSIASEVRSSAWLPDDALSEAMAAGWQGVKAEWLKNRNPPVAAGASGAQSSSFAGVE